MLSVASFTIFLPKNNEFLLFYSFFNSFYFDISSQSSTFCVSLVLTIFYADKSGIMVTPGIKFRFQS